MLLGYRRRRIAAAQDHIELVAERMLRHRRVDIESCDQPRTRVRIGDAVEDRIDREQRVAREIHLRDEPRGEARAEQAEMDVSGTPCVVMIAPWIRARLDRREAIDALAIGHNAAIAREMRIEWGLMLVHAMRVAAG